MSNQSNSAFFSRQCGPSCVQLLFNYKELGIRPIRYFSNLGSVHPHSQLKAKVKEVKKAVGDHTGNGICRLYYYQGARVTHPFHVMWRGNEFQLTVYDPFGESKNALKIIRTVSSDQERLTTKELVRIGNYLQLHSHLVKSAYDFAVEEMPFAKTYNDVFKRIREIKQALHDIDCVEV